MSWIKNIFKKSSPITEYKSIAGHNFRVLEPAKMPNIRRARFYLEEYTRDWGINKTDIRAYLKAILSEIGIGNLNNIHTLVSILDCVIAEDYQYKPYLKAASIVVLIEGEDPNKIEAKWMSQKLKLCQENPEIEAFFLTTIRVLQSNLVRQSDTSSNLNWQPSSSQKHMENLLYKKINSTIYSDGNL